MTPGYPAPQKHSSKKHKSRGPPTRSVEHDQSETSTTLTSSDISRHRRRDRKKEKKQRRARSTSLPRKPSGNHKKRRSLVFKADEAHLYSPKEMERMQQEMVDMLRHHKKLEQRASQVNLLQGITESDSEEIKRGPAKSRGYSH